MGSRVGIQDHAHPRQVAQSRWGICLVWTKESFAVGSLESLFLTLLEEPPSQDLDRGAIARGAAVSF